MAYCVRFADRAALALVAGMVLAGSGVAVNAQGKWVPPTGHTQKKKPLLDEVNFETDASVLATGYPTLACVAEAVKADPTLFLVVEGYADARGSLPYNLRLSEARARSVAEYLVYLGVPQNRMRAIGMGSLGKSGDKVVNFQNRKVIVLPKRGSFDGDAVESLPATPLPCGERAMAKLPGSDSPVPVARIESNGQTFLISVNYPKIRADIRAEVSRAISAAKGQAYEELGRTPASSVAPRDPAPTPVRFNSSMGSEAVPARPERPGEKGPQPQAMVIGGVDGLEREYRVDLAYLSTNAKPETSIGRFAGGYLVKLPPFGTDGGAGVQVGVQGEMGSYRRRLQADLAFSLTEGPVQATAFGSYASVAGMAVDLVPLPTAVPGTRTGILGGARLGLEYRPFGVGISYATIASSQQALGGDEPRPFWQVDLRGSFSWLDARARVGGSREIVKGGQPESINGKVWGGLELAIRPWKVGPAVLLVVEKMPVYVSQATIGGPKGAETRMGLGLRFGGRNGGTLPSWVNVPSVRSYFPY